MKEIKPKKYTNSKKLICDCTDKRKILGQYGMLKFYVTHGMIVDKNHEISSFKQSMWLKKYINYNTQKRNVSKNAFEKYFYKLLNNVFYGKTM